MLESGHGAVVYCIPPNMSKLFWKSGFIFFSSLRGSIMHEGVMVLKNKNMSIFIISKENILSNWWSAWLCSLLQVMKFWKSHIGTHKA